MHPLIKRRIYQVIPYGVIWLFFSLLYVLIERGLLGHSTVYPATGNSYSFRESFLLSTSGSLITGLLMGVVEIFVLKSRFRRFGFLQKLILKSLIFLSIIIAFLLLLTIIANGIQLHQSPFSAAVLHKVHLFVGNYAFWSITMYISGIVVLCQLYTEVRDSAGDSMLSNFFTGKYHIPKEEERVFMFLDMRGSTTWAESLGHNRYFEMLRAYYADLSAAIIAHEGSVYQYAGDEVIITWTMKKAMRNLNCLRCFIAMKKALQQNAGRYTQKYGSVPSFKAGLHCGTVTTGEIGVLKKEIVFTGDVLNTTARIQALCNQYETDILISAPLVKALGAEIPFVLRPMGLTALRGKEEKIGLFTLDTAPDAPASAQA